MLVFVVSADVSLGVALFMLPEVSPVVVVPHALPVMLPDVPLRRLPRRPRRPPPPILPPPEVKEMPLRTFASGVSVKLLPL